MTRLSCECRIRTAVALGPVAPITKGLKRIKGDVVIQIEWERGRGERPQSSGELLKLILKHVRNFNEICVCVFPPASVLVCVYLFVHIYIQ